MGVQGVPIRISQSEITEAIKKHKGVVSRIHDALGMGHDTFYKLLKKHPGLQESLNEARESHRTELSDVAEDALLKALSQRDDMNVALKAAFFVLNNLGKDRGYNHPNAEVKKATLADLLKVAEAEELTQSGVI